MTPNEQAAAFDRASRELVADVERLTVPWHHGAATFTRALARQAPQQGTALTVIASLGLRQSAVQSRLRRADLPSPKEQLAAFRLALALRLRSSHATVKELAYSLDYSSPQSFGRHIRERCGMSAVCFLGRWTPDAFWSEVVAPFMLWDDARWLDLDVMGEGIPQRLTVVAENVAVRLASKYSRKAVAV